jgi:serine/threonine protein kinase
LTLSQLPPNIRIVYRVSDLKKTELIAKRVRKRSNENENEHKILQYLHTIRPPSPHVITHIETISAASETWLILPKLYSIRNKLAFDGGSSLRGTGKIQQFCWGLIKGIAYLHENGIAHLDIKPDNLVYDDVHLLKIVDFDIAVRVKDEDEEIKGYRGTRGWTAPEVGEEDGPELRYSAIKADRWACGRVLHRFLEIEGRDYGFSTVVAQLTARNPRERPSLLEWPKWASVAQPKPNGTDAIDLNLGAGGMCRRRRDTADVDEGGVQTPFVKKPRVVAPGQGQEMTAFKLQTLQSMVKA